MATSPGNNVPRVKTAVFAAGWLLTTTMFVKVTLPVLLTLPVNVNSCPGLTGPSGHVLVTLMPWVRASEHVRVVDGPRAERYGAEAVEARQQTEAIRKVVTAREAIKTV